MTRKRSHTTAAPVNSGFAMMLTSLNLILLSLFVLLNAIAVRDNARVKKALGSLRGTFGILYGGQNISRNGRSPLKSVPIAFGRVSKQTDELLAAVKALTERQRMSATKDNISVMQTADGLQLDLAKPLFFSKEQTVIDPRCFALLDGIGDIIRGSGRTVNVLGYAGATLSADMSKLDLATARAVNIARYLIEAADVRPDTVIATGSGISQPGKTADLVRIVFLNKSLAQPLNRKEVAQ